MEWLTGGHVKAGMHEVRCRAARCSSQPCTDSWQLCASLPIVASSLTLSPQFVLPQVVVSEATMAAVDAARAAGRPRWRVSSTVFGHIASDQVHAAVTLFSHSAGWHSRNKAPFSDFCCNHRLESAGCHTELARINALQVLTPLGGFATEQAQALYPDVTAGDFVQRELESIRLKA